MDPFGEVLVEAQQQLTRAQRLHEEYQDDPVQTRLADLNNAIQEITETIHDLSQSIAAVQAAPDRFGVDAAEITRRVEQVGHINNQVTDIQQAMADARKKREAAAQSAMSPLVGGTQSAAGQPTPGGQSDLDDARHLMYQDAIYEQDNVLDSVHTTVNTLREQAHVMTRELEDHAVMLDEFEHEADTAADRLKRGMKRVQWVLDNNRETLSSCCITLLIVVLVILLILVIIA